MSDVAPMPTTLVIVTGIAVGALLGCLLFWPNLLGARLDIEAIRYLSNKGGADFNVLIVPWIIKTVVCAGIGGSLGFAWGNIRIKNAH